MKTCATSTPWGLAGLVALAALWPASGHACGACVEDKVAVVYDHTVVQQAAANDSVVVFCEVVGPMDLARVQSAARSARGVKPSSVRVSRQPGALSFMVDTKMLTPRDVVKDIQRALGRTLQLSIVHLRMPEARSAQ